MENRKNNSRTVTVALILLIIFILILILFLFLIKKPAIFSSFAQMENSASTLVSPGVTGPQSISYDNSYIFASPLKAQVGAQRIRVTAYILDGQGMGVGGKSVILANDNPALHVYAVTQVTDDYGRATFDVSSETSGLFTIEASVDGKKISQKVSVSFN